MELLVGAVINITKNKFICSCDSASLALSRCYRLPTVKRTRCPRAGRMTLQLLDQRSRIVTTTITAYDGFYVLSNVPVGT